MLREKGWEFYSKNRLLSRKGGKWVGVAANRAVSLRKREQRGRRNHEKTIIRGVCLLVHDGGVGAVYGVCR